MRSQGSGSFWSMLGRMIRAKVRLVGKMVGCSLRERLGLLMLYPL